MDKNWLNLYLQSWTFHNKFGNTRFHNKLTFTSTFDGKELIFRDVK